MTSQSREEGMSVPLDDLWAILWDDLRHNATGKPTGAAIIEKHRPAIEEQARAPLAAVVAAARDYLHGDATTGLSTDRLREALAELDKAAKP